MPISSEVSKVEYRNRGGYIYYFDGWYLYASYFLNREEMEQEKNILKIGDSLYKKPNSLSIKIYRKNKEGRYTIFTEWSGI